MCVRDWHRNKQLEQNSAYNYNLENNDTQATHEGYTYLLRQTEQLISGDETSKAKNRKLHKRGVILQIVQPVVWLLYFRLQLGCIHHHGSGSHSQAHHQKKKKKNDITMIL